MYPYTVTDSGQLTSYCQYCAAPLNRDTLNLDDRSAYNIFEIVLKSCENCGWWALCRRDYRTGELFWYALLGTVKHYALDALDVPLSDLRDFLQRHPEQVYSVHPTKFEHLMTDCLRAYFPEAEVIHVGQTGDNGIDIKLVLTDQDAFLVQVKRRQSSDATEGVQTVRELNGVLFRENRSRGMIITTASRFTRARFGKPESNVRQNHRIRWYSCRFRTL